MKKFPNNIVYSRPHKIKTMKGTKGINLSRYTAGLRMKASAYLSYEQLEACRRVVSRLIKPKEIKNKKNQKIAQSTQKKSLRNVRRNKAKRKKILLIRSNLCLPLTKKPLQVRMGKGKGAVDKWVFSARQSRVIFEMSRQQYKLSHIKNIFYTTSKKLPINTKFTFDRSRLRRETKFSIGHFLNIYKRNNVLSIPINLNPIKRNMHRATGPIIHQGTKLLPHIPKLTTNMSTLAAKKYSKTAAKDLANDGKSNHTHIEKETCVKPDCEITQCQTLCDTLKETATKGHNTHKPPIGRFCRFVSKTDTNGNPQAQYFVPTNEKKKIPASQVNSYGPQIKPNTKQQSYIDKYTNTYDQD